MRLVLVCLKLIKLSITAISCNLEDYTLFRIALYTLYSPKSKKHDKDINIFSLISK